MIKSFCSFSTVCVGMALSLCRSSDDLKRDSRVSEAALKNHNRPEQKENYSLISWLSFPSVTLSLSISIISGSPHSLSALCKRKVIYSLTFPVLKRMPGAQSPVMVVSSGIAFR